MEAGRSATYDRTLSAGWHHLAAVKTNDRLQLFIDGDLVSESSNFNPDQYDLTNQQSLKIGFGQHDYFNGKMKDLRIYNRALSKDEIGHVRSKVTVP